MDESADVSDKEQITLGFCFVAQGIVIERFLCMIHVKETSSISLKRVVDSLFAKIWIEYKEANMTRL